MRCKVKVYLVKADRSTYYENESTIIIYDTYKKAYLKFKKLVCEAKSSKYSWISMLKWKHDFPIGSQYEFNYLARRDDTDETECFWGILNKPDPVFHTYISIEIKEVL